MSPLVTVIIPAYNSERYIAEAVRSVIDQDHAPVEILVIDDGSTDGTVQALEAFGRAVTVVRVPNGGPARARNLGMREARGEYIAFLDADDVWAQGKLAAQVRHLSDHPEVGVCFTRWHVWPANADGCWQRPASFVNKLPVPASVSAHAGWLYERLLFDCLLLTTTVMLRTSIAREVGEFDPSLRVGEDYDYWLRLSQRTRMDQLDVIGALYRVVPGSESRRPHAVNHELLVIQRAVEQFGLGSPSGEQVTTSRIDERLHHLVLQHAWSHLRQGDPSIARRGFQQCLARRPWSLPLWARWTQALGLSIFHPTRVPVA